MSKEKKSHKIWPLKVYSNLKGASTGGRPRIKQSSNHLILLPKSNYECDVVEFLREKLVLKEIQPSSRSAKK